MEKVMRRGISTNLNVTAQVACLQSLGIDFVFRYYSTTTTQRQKRLTRSEAEALTAAGLQIGVVYEDKPDSVAYFSQSRGHQDGVNACHTARSLLQPAGSCIYFAVDYDASPAHIVGPILDYFNGVNQGMKDAGSGINNYAVGVYGSGAVCDFIKAHCLFVTFSWLAESSGWLGSRTYASWDVSQAIATSPLCGFSASQYEENAARDNFGGFVLDYALPQKALALAATPPPDVDTNASDQDRANALWNVVSSVAADFDSPANRDNTQRFMMYIAWHEGAQLTTRVQQAGPARSFFQIQGASAQTAYNSSSMTDNRINTLATFTSSTHDAIVTAFEALTASASFPSGNLIATLLESSDIFGAYVARALLWTFSEPLPDRKSVV